MKFSISWIFDHLTADWCSIDIEQMVTKFNRITAEIEHFERVSYDLSALTLAMVQKIEPDQIVLFSPEFNKEFTLNPRESIWLGEWYLLKKEPTTTRWALLSDVHSEKEGALPALHCNEHDQKGGWKNKITDYDYILEVDNKSMTHRPDLWGHRGMAREIGAFLNISLKPYEELLSSVPVERLEKSWTATSKNLLHLSNQAPVQCKTIAGLYVGHVQQQSSHIFTAFRLACVDNKPINALVDLTNYVMNDIGAPMHVFDAEHIANTTLTVRMAKNHEKLVLLDGDTVELTNQDLVIADTEKALSLAGIMGGKLSGVGNTTKNIIIEAGCFDASTIRHTSARVKKRSDASARFEKNLDADQPIYAIRRFLKLAQEQNIAMDRASDVVVIGDAAKTGTITILHSSIQKKLGVEISLDRIVEILTRIECNVTTTQNGDDTEIIVRVPRFRATKDLIIKEDIVEEIARFYGYDVIKPKLPVHQLKPWNTTPVMRTRAIKEFLAYGCCMQEVYNYALYDEQFLQKLGWQPGETLRVQFPVSEHWQRLVTSLIPHLIKNLYTNAESADSLRFFEFGRIWVQRDGEWHEKRVVAGIFAHQKEQIDFYTGKQELQRLFNLLGLCVSWIAITESDTIFAQYESAYIMHEGEVIGKVGKINSSLLHKVLHGDAFIFELDGDFLMHHKTVNKKFRMPSKYPAIDRDISMFIPEAVTVNQVTSLVKNSNGLIQEVTLMDYVTNQAWKDRKAMTVRFVLQDFAKTLTKDEADDITATIITALKNLGAEIR